MRLKNKIAIVVGAGQSPGEGLGNGRATVLRFAQDGAKILAVDNNLSSAEETVALARQGGGECVAFEADVTAESTLTAMIHSARQRWGRIDVLHYNVGVSIAGGHARHQALRRRRRRAGGPAAPAPRRCPPQSWPDRQE